LNIAVAKGDTKLFVLVAHGLQALAALVLGDLFAPLFLKIPHDPSGCPRVYVDSFFHARSSTADEYSKREKTTTIPA
jgi:hypothetical protein